MECWKKAREYCSGIYAICVDTSLSKNLSLKDQIERASGSVMDNIAEGFDRGGNKEFIQFLYIAKSSASETKSQLYRILDRKYISIEIFEKLYKECEEIQKMISGLIKHLKESELKGKKFNHS